MMGHESGDFSAVKPPEHIVQIDVDPLANGSNYANSYFVCADAALTLQGLLRADRRQDAGRSLAIRMSSAR